MTAMRHKSQDTKFMRFALELAKKAEDRTFPNPMVGCVIVKNGRIIGKGYHRKAGKPHAEIEALRSLNSSPKGAAMFVTLEPCNHFGKTPPCAPAIVKSGIKRVVAAMPDPNPIVKGRGMRYLRRNGVKTEAGLLEKEARFLNRKYLRFITTGLPYVTVKLAESLDGKIAARDNSSKWITSDASRAHARRLRSSFDAVMVGANTVIKDDPMLFGGGSRNPVRLTVDAKLRLPVSSNVIKTARKAPVIIGTTFSAPKKRIKKFSGIKGVEVIVLKGKSGKVPLRQFFKALAKKGIMNILVEGGGELAGSLLDNGLVNEWMFFIAPKIIGGVNTSVRGKGVPNMKKAVELHHVNYMKENGDILVRGIACSRA